MHLSRPLWLLKVGGRLCDDPGQRARLAAAVKGAAAQAYIVLVHGGGCVVSDLQKALGQQATFVDGKRITDAAQLAVIEGALSGTVNKAMVRALQHSGLRAVGLSGVDDAMMRCHAELQLGAVGRPQQAHTGLLTLLLTHGFTPVLSPVSMAATGDGVLNVNADEFACALAAALGAQRLLLLSDVAAVRIAQVDQSLLHTSEIEPLIAAGEVTGGMVPKLRAAVYALQHGVQQVLMGALRDDLSATNAGTRIQSDEG